MKAGREDMAMEKDAAAQAKEKPAAIVAAAVGVTEGAVAVTGGGAPSVVTTPAAVTAVGEQAEEEVAVDLEEQRAKRKREHFELVDAYYEVAELANVKFKNDAVEFEEEVSDELSEEANGDVDHDKDSRDNKSRYILSRLRNGEIPYRTQKRYGYISYPFCTKDIARDFNSMIQHTTCVGKGLERKHKPIVKAGHAAIGAFLRKYVVGHEAFYVPPPPRPAKKAKN